MKPRTYPIKEAAEIAGVSSRTLRHYDEIGLLVPSFRSATGYRLYTDADLLRLQQILLGRALGLALEDIRRTIDDPTLDRKQLLLQQREALQAKAHATANMIRSIDTALALIDPQATKETHTVDMKTLFDGFDPAEFEPEAQARWGETDAYKESSRRTRAYKEGDWQTIKAEAGQILADAAKLIREGVKPEAPQGMDIAERYRCHVDRWFYPCSHDMYAKLADLYEADERFTQYFEKHAKGLAAFVSQAARANAKRAG